MKAYLDELEVGPRLARALGRTQRIYLSTLKDRVKKDAKLARKYRRSLRKEVIALETLGLEAEPEEAAKLWGEVKKARSSKEENDTIAAIKELLKGVDHG